MRAVALIPAHNEEASIRATVLALRAQDYPLERVIVVADNCADATAAVAREAGAEVIELHGNPHKKPGALNTAWRLVKDETDILVTVDADTVLPSNAVYDWVEEFRTTPRLGGCSAKFTMRLPSDGRWARLLTRLQRAEFARWTDTALHRRDRSTSVLAGTACALRVAALEELATGENRPGPWVYTSDVEDFELTYRLRQSGWHTRVSADVRAYTDAMHTVRSLWAQRMKWQTGTVADLRSFGFNRLTARDWGQQALGALNVVTRVAYPSMLLATLLSGRLQWQWYWWLPTAIFIANDAKQSLRIPDRDWLDVALAAVLVPQEVFAWLRAGWFVTAWVEVLVGRKADRWERQYDAEKGGDRICTTEPVRP